MLLQKNKQIDAFDFLNYLHERLTKHYYSNGLDPEVSGKMINQYLSILFRFDKQTTRKVLTMLEKKGLICIQKSKGNGGFSVLIKINREVLT
jgi:uncharacterized UBP type Zn finger protein